MTSSRIVPCLWFDDQAEAAAAFYTETFPEGRVIAVSRYPVSGENPGGKPPGSVLTVELELAGLRLTALNGGPQLTLNPSISFFAHTDTAAEADRLFARLAEGGTVTVPLGEYPWSERYGWATDRFGVSWQVIAGRRAETGANIVPCLSFADAGRGRAEEAMRAYVDILGDGRMISASRYTADEGPEGWIKHGRFVVAGQEIAAMDSHLPTGFTFTEALSLQVMCDDQAEVDRLWEALSEGGEQGPCGWLKDRFGLSWQVVPSAAVGWMTSPDVAARDRAFKAMMAMRRPEIAALEAAFEGR